MSLSRMGITASEGNVLTFTPDVSQSSKWKTCVENSTMRSASHSLPRDGFQWKSMGLSDLVWKPLNLFSFYFKNLHLFSFFWGCCAVSLL